MDSVRKWETRTEFAGGGFVPWRPGYVLPARCTVTLDGEHLPYRVEVQLAADPAGVQARAITFHARDAAEPIAARRLRDVPVAECIEVAISTAAMPATERDGVLSIELGGSGEVTRTVELARTDARTSDAHLRAVADVYSAAEEKPTSAVQQHFAPISYSTAARWVMEARRRGFLPPHKKERRR